MNAPPRYAKEPRTQEVGVRGSDEVRSMETSLERKDQIGGEANLAGVVAIVERQLIG